MNTTEHKPVDVLAVMRGLRDLARHRLTMKRRDFDRMAAAGKEPNVLESIKAERAEYFVQQADDALAAVAELIDRHAELEVAAARLAVERAEFRRDREVLGEALLVALPYVTDAEGYPEQFKPGVVKKHVEQIHAALARVQGGAK